MVFYIITNCDYITIITIINKYTGSLPIMLLFEKIVDDIQCALK